MIERIKSWLLGRRVRKDKDAPDLHYRDKELDAATRRNIAASRLVKMKAAKTGRTLHTLSEILALQAKAIEGITAADDALRALDEAKKRDDK